SESRVLNRSVACPSSCGPAGARRGRRFGPDQPPNLPCRGPPGGQFQGPIPSPPPRRPGHRVPLFWTGSATFPGVKRFCPTYKKGPGMQALGTELRHPGVTIEHVFRQVRVTTCNLCLPLEPEDYTVQSMPDASPTKWHLAHTSWFFEQFLLEDHLPGYWPFRRAFGFLFNSYYQSGGPMHRRAERGLLTRPTIAEVMQYR